MEGADNISFNGLMKETDGLWRQLAVSELSMHPAIGEIADRVRKPVVRVSPRNEHGTKHGCMSAPEDRWCGSYCRGRGNDAVSVGSFHLDSFVYGRSTALVDDLNLRTYVHDVGNVA